MIKIKTKEELKIMAESGRILTETLWEVVKNVKPGVSEIELDTLAEKLNPPKRGRAGISKSAGI